MIRQLLWLPLLPSMALAADDFARQWPLQLSRADAGAYRVPLDASVYTAAHWPDLRDVRVVDADGVLVASAVQAAAELGATPAQRVELPWFVVPASPATASGDLSVVVQRGADGRLSIRNALGAGAGDGADPVWLVDLGAQAPQLRALRVEWADPAATVDVGYRLEASSDLRSWQVIDPQVRLLQSSNQGRVLRQDRIALATSQRYLRLVPLQRHGAPALRRLLGELGTRAEAGDWQWQDLRADAAGDPRKGFIYTLRGRFPVQRIDVAMPANTTATWQLASREAPAGKDPARDGWRVHAGRWNTWSLSEAGQLQRSPPLSLDSTVMDRQWRLLAQGAAVSEAPVLRLGYRPGSVVFLAQGKPPYALVAGSAAEVAASAPLAPLLAGLRERHGPQWQPAAAALGQGTERTGESAYQPAVPPRDWKRALLWVVLVVGALVVAGFALALLRGGRGQPGGG